MFVWFFVNMLYIYIDIFHSNPLLSIYVQLNHALVKTNSTMKLEMTSFHCSPISRWIEFCRDLCSLMDGYMYAARKLQLLWGSSLLQTSLWSAIQNDWQPREELWWLPTISNIISIKLISLWKTYISSLEKNLPLSYFFFFTFSGTPKVVKQEKPIDEVKI